LVYRSFKRHYTGLGAKSPEQTPAARYLYSLIGLNTEALRGPSSSGNPAVNTKRTLLHYAGLLAREVRTMSGLAALLTLHFSVPVEGVPLTGAFYAIEPEHQTLLGRRGQNQRLGHTAIVGARYWDQEAAFELKIGPLTEDEYLRFLPEGDALTPLCQLTRFYVGDCLDYRVRLLLDPESARAARPEKRRRVSTQAAKNSGARALLGRTAWVGTAWKTREIVLSGKSLPKDREI
jgi:type VI secretion system protein ImpH